MRGRIAFFLPSVRGGGAQRVIVNLVQGIVQRGEPVDVALAMADGVFLDHLPPEVRVVDLGARRLIGGLLPLRRYLRRERPRVLVSSMSHANMVALWAAKAAGRSTPVMVTVHNTMSESTGSDGGLEHRLLRTFYPWATWIVAVSRGAADDLARTTGSAPVPDRGGVQPGDHSDAAGAGPRGARSPVVRPRRAARHSRRRAAHPAEGLPDPRPRIRRAAPSASGAADYPW